MIYMDNAATSWPKPKTVRTAINEALDHAGNPRQGNAQLHRMVLYEAE